jgi:hypothetical protein
MARIEGGMVEANAESVWIGRLTKLVVLSFVFPILVLVFHMLLLVPAMFLDSLLIHFNGHPDLWAKVLTVGNFVPACWGAFLISKRIWPSSKKAIPPSPTDSHDLPSNPAG